MHWHAIAIHVKAANAIRTNRNEMGTTARKRKSKRIPFAVALDPQMGICLNFVRNWRDLPFARIQLSIAGD